MPQDTTRNIIVLPGRGIALTLLEDTKATAPDLGATSARLADTPGAITGREGLDSTWSPNGLCRSSVH